MRSIDHFSVELGNAATCGDLKEVKRLISSGVNVMGASCMALQYACQFGYPEIVKCLVEAGADITVSYNQPIRMSARNGHLEIVKYLVGLGADITVDNNYAIGWAALYGHYDTVKYLVSLGGDVNIAMKEAIERNRLKIVKYLVSVGGDVEVCDKYTFRPGMYCYYPRMVKYLVTLAMNKIKKYTLLLLLNKRMIIHKDLICFFVKPPVKYLKHYRKMK